MLDWCELADTMTKVEHMRTLGKGIKDYPSLPVKLFASGQQ